ncbi:hypothetical protein [Devosia sp. RR2S18]|uniref:hypothetical protein n=1 Tax=Devosia rhizosphaerae TaxID=3049774 RepID=UPI00254047CA|nr:hypothetical protein [Devosia sp. RR2S18]WIJ26366.1 hypothetical protein QOV41_06285 [Devosia sp. RR2S18]
MADLSKGTLYLRLVLDTTHSRIYHETLSGDELSAEEGALDEALRLAIVEHFRALLSTLTVDLMCLDYEVVDEYYTDLLATDYELRISSAQEDDAAAIADLRKEFVAKAEAFLADLPDLLSRLP